MRFHAVAVTMMLAALPTFAIAHADAEPLGRYCGKLSSAGEIVDAQTTFQAQADGRLFGTYLFRDGQTATDGRLQEQEKKPGLIKELRWTDKYGYGRLVITFDPAFTRFEGYWGMLDGTPDKMWTGERCQEPNS